MSKSACAIGSSIPAVTSPVSVIKQTRHPPALSRYPHGATQSCDTANEFTAISPTRLLAPDGKGCQSLSVFWVRDDVLDVADSSGVVSSSSRGTTRPVSLKAEPVVKLVLRA